MVGMSSSTFEARTPLAADVKFTDNLMSVTFSDGRALSVPMAWYPRLSHGTAQERSNWRIVSNGSGIHWPDLDEDISIRNLLEGQPSGESQASLKGWLEQRQHLSS